MRHRICRHTRRATASRECNWPVCRQSSGTRRESAWVCRRSKHRRNARQRKRRSTQPCRRKCCWKRGCVGPRAPRDAMRDGFHMDPLQCFRLFRPVLKRKNSNRQYDLENPNGLCRSYRSLWIRMPNDGMRLVNQSGNITRSPLDSNSANEWPRFRSDHPGRSRPGRLPPEQRRLSGGRRTVVLVGPVCKKKKQKRKKTVLDLVFITV